MRTLLTWVAAPWLCGVSAGLALALGRALVDGHWSGGKVDLPLCGAYLVAARSHVIGAALLATTVAVLLALVVSRAAAAWP